tara:strand:+ start:782 stop:1297 length:516 start_codon:yes stop_codon:yes gene_type:complete
MSTLKVDTIQGKTTAGTVAMPAGMVIQTLEAFDYTQGTMTSSSFVDTGLSLSVTPKFSTSKILIMVKHQFYAYGNASAFGGLKLQKTVGGSTSDVCMLDSMLCYAYQTSFTLNATQNAVGFVLDSPATTSQVTYKTQYNLTNNTGEININADHTSASENSRGSMIIQEIAQ